MTNPHACSRCKFAAASKIAGNTFDFPVAVAGRVGAFAAAFFNRRRCYVSGLCLAALFGLFQGIFGIFLLALGLGHGLVSAI